jgi:predicted DCC family thiol-disulfide oxidoreductase YuxK
VPFCAHAARFGFLAMTTPLFLFDGDCGLCKNYVDRMKKRIDLPINFVTYQSVDIIALGVNLASCLEGPALVRADGTHVIGVGAMAGMLRTAGYPYRFFGCVMLAPGVSPLLTRVQAIFYRNRHRLPGGTESCRIPPG